MNSVPLSGDIYDDQEFRAIMSSHYIRELAFESAAVIIGNSISKCEFKTYQKGLEIKGQEYYLWNVEPNKNQNSSAFLHKLIHQLLRMNECLVIEYNGQLLVADSFQRKPYALYDDVFTQVTVGDFPFSQSFSGADVLYFQHQQVNIMQLVGCLNDSYDKLLEYSMKAHQRSRGSRGTMDISAIAKGAPDFNKTLDDMLQNRLKKFFTADNAVLPLFEGWKYSEVGGKTYSNESTRDIRAMIDDIYDFTAKALNIPPTLLRGDIAGMKDGIDMLLTFCIDPLTDNLQEEINRKRNGRAGFLAGNYLQIDTKAIKHVDLLSVSTAIEKLIGSSVFCVNDIRKLCGEQIIDEPWAWQHWMTKNFSATDALLNPMQGGDPNI